MTEIRAFHETQKSAEKWMLQICMGRMGNGAQSKKKTHTHRSPRKIWEEKRDLMRTDKNKAKNINKSVQRPKETAVLETEKKNKKKNNRE